MPARHRSTSRHGSHAAVTLDGGAPTASGPTHRNRTPPHASLGFDEDMGVLVGEARGIPCGMPLVANCLHDPIITRFMLDILMMADISLAILPFAVKHRCHTPSLGWCHAT